MKPSVLIELDRPRRLRLDTNALIVVEEVLAKPLPEIGTSMGLREVRAILWAGLRWEDPALTLEAAGDLMDASGYEYIAGKVDEAVRVAMGGTAEESDPN